MASESALQFEAELRCRDALAALVNAVYGSGFSVTGDCARVDSVLAEFLRVDAERDTVSDGGMDRAGTTAEIVLRLTLLAVQLTSARSGVLQPRSEGS
jgi:hypothetical protein